MFFFLAAPETDCADINWNNPIRACADAGCVKVGRVLYSVDLLKTILNCLVPQIIP